MQFGDSFDVGSSRLHASLLVDIPNKIFSYYNIHIN